MVTYRSLVLVVLTMIILNKSLSQIFIPFGYWVGKSATIGSIANTDGPQYVQVSQALTINSQSVGHTCSATYLSATSSNTSVLSLANITFSGTFPACFVNMLTQVNTGTSNVGITFINTWNQSATANFTFTAFGKPVMAFSFRKVVQDYLGSPIRVRRVSDDAESDIGFDGSGNLDLTTYNTFKGASSLRLTTWYDQTGNGYNATQVTKTLQPTITTNGFNGAPQVEFTNTYWLATTQAQNILSANRDVTIFYATKAVSESRTIFGVRETGNICTISRRPYRRAG